MSSEPPKPPAFPAPRSRTPSEPPYRQARAKASEPKIEERAAPRIVHRPSVVEETEAPPKDGAARPTFSKEEVRALLEVSKASAGRKEGGSPWLNRRLIVVPTGGVIWIVRALLPTQVVLVLTVLWIVAMGFWLRRVIRDARDW